MPLGSTPLGLYTIRTRGQLGATGLSTALSAFPSMVCELKSDETVFTGSLEDRSALFGVISQIEALGLELVELRRSEPIEHAVDRRGETTERGPA